MIFKGIIFNSHEFKIILPGDNFYHARFMVESCLN